MRRLVLILMMVLLPLQYSWAAAASVCEHEADSAHFGHHEHKHAVSDAHASHGGEAKSDGKSPSPHLDCEVCHGIGAGYVASGAAVGPAWTPDRLVPAYGHHMPEPPVERFLRPPLNLVA